MFYSYSRPEVMLRYSPPTSSKVIEVTKGDFEAVKQYGQFSASIVQLQAQTLMDSHPQLYKMGVLLCRPPEQDLTSLGRLLPRRTAADRLLEEVVNAAKKSAAAWSYLVIPIRQDLRWSLLVVCRDSRRAYRFDAGLWYTHTPSGEVRDDGRNSSAASHWEAVSTKLLFSGELGQSSEGGSTNPQLLRLTPEEKLKQAAFTDRNEGDQFSVFSGNDELVYGVPQCEAEESGAVVCALMQMIVEHAICCVDPRFPGSAADLEPYFEDLILDEITLRQQTMRNKMSTLIQVQVEKQKKSDALEWPILNCCFEGIIILLAVLPLIVREGSKNNLQVFLKGSMNNLRAFVSL